jgi:hypothetical protein
MSREGPRERSESGRAANSCRAGQDEATHKLRRAPAVERQRNRKSERT